MPQPALSHQRRVEEDSRDDGAGDKEGLEALRADVRDVSNALVGVHGAIVWAARGGPDDQHGDEHAEPCESRDDGEDLVEK